MPKRRCNSPGTGIGNGTKKNGAYLVERLLHCSVFYNIEPKHTFHINSNIHKKKLKLRLKRSEISLQLQYYAGIARSTSIPSSERALDRLSSIVSPRVDRNNDIPAKALNPLQASFSFPF